MKVTLLSRIAVTLFVSASLVSLQGQEREWKMSDNLVISAPLGWKLSNQSRDSIEIHVPLAKQRKYAGGGDEKELKPRFVIASEAGMLITREHRRDHAEAVRRLAEIASEYPERASLLLIVGWPAIERRYRSLMPQPGEEGVSSGNIVTSFTTTAVAVGDTVLRFETMLAPEADPKLLDEALSIGRSLRAPEGPRDTSQRELEEVQKLTRPVRKPTQAAPPRPAQLVGRKAKPQTGRKHPGVAVQVQPGLGELEVASNDGQHVVVAANSGFSFSDNFGAAWTSGGGTPCNQAACDGDPSLAVGNSGNIFYAWIGGTSIAALSDGVSRSTDNGHTFTFRGLAATCPGATGCSVADQEHIAADRNNAAAGGGDRVYNVWRNFAPSFSIRISCSTDSGATWTAGIAIAAGDLPRVSVGGDGFVYVAWPSGGSMMLHKYSDCDAGLVPQVGWPVTVTAFTNVACPVAGLDRCNGRNILSSQKVAVDDLDPRHIYYAFATSTGAGNEDVMVFDSSDGGATFPRSVRVNNAVAARRYMPWISSYGGIAVVSWYDRRNSTMANNDLTRYFIGGVAVRGPNLVALTETDLSGTNDTQCSTWPCATNATTDSESCSIQPQLGGRCMVTWGPPPVGSGTACDFSSSTCPMGESCLFNRGCPKYGDYNGNAAGAGRMFSAWSSAVPPASVGGAGGAIRVYASADRIPSDFFVRDWNASPNFDNGAQPSTNPVFWATSDVWNQNTNTPNAPGPDGSIAGDPPSRAGSNFVYARVFRRAPAMNTAPNATVTVNFFYGDYGLGSAFVPIGSESVTFAAGDMSTITPAHAWTVPMGASSHLCLAVQIAGPDGDTFALPTISGIAPGPADPLIIADNNKAQRNLQDTVGTSAGTELMIMISNIERKRRSMQLRISLPRGVHLEGKFDVIGGSSVEISNDGRIDLGVLAPREIRFLRFHAGSLSGIDNPIPIHVYEDTNPPANGFTILLHREPIEKVAQRNLKELAGLLKRLAEIDHKPQAKKLSDLALHASLNADAATYAAFLKKNRKLLSELTAPHIPLAKAQDRFAVVAAEKELWSALEQNNIDRVALANTQFVERLDAHITAAMRAKPHE